MNTRHLTSRIGLIILLGIAVGWGYREYAKDTTAAKDIASYFSIITDIFLRMIKMIIAPLMSSTLVTGLVSVSDGRSVDRVGLRAMIWFVCTSATSLVLDILLVSFFRPGVHMSLALPNVSATSDLETGDFILKAFVTHVFPYNIVGTMAINEILQVLVFSLFFDTALSTMKNPMDSMIGHGLEEPTKLMFRITDCAMCFAPLGIFATVAAAITMEGVGVLQTYGRLIDEFYLGPALLWAILFLVGYILLDRLLGRLLGLIREPMLLTFAIASSEPAYPKTIEALDRFGVPKRVSSFVLPPGYPFNLDDSMVYQAFVVLFIAQACDIGMSFAQQVALLLVLVLADKGMTGVARVSLVVVTATLPMFHLPEAGLLLIIGVDQFFGIGRTATNMIGNSLATTVVAKYEPAKDEAAANAAEPAVQPAVS